MQEKNARSFDADGSPSEVVKQLATAYWGSAILFSANHLGVFERLSEVPLTAPQLAEKLGADAASTVLLLNACVSLGLLEKRGQLYSNSEAASSHLVRDRQGYLGEAIKYTADLYPAWGHLSDTVITGRPILAPSEILGSDPEKTRHFVLGMHNRALAVAPQLADLLDLRGMTRLLDVGGGPGTYSAMLVEKTPGLRATVLDLPSVAEIGRQLIEEGGYSDRIHYSPGDYNVIEFPAPFDVVLMSGMLHREQPINCRRLFRKAFGVLEIGGLVVASDIFFADEEKISPPFAAVFALNMRLTSEGGGTHALPEVEQWMLDEGFQIVSSEPFPNGMPHSVIVAKKVQT